MVCGRCSAASAYASKQGEVVTILGPNGMGKSTLLGVMAGVLSPQRGSVLIDGLRRRGSEEEELEIRKRSVYLPDQPWLPANRTAREFLLAVGRLYDVEQERLIDHVHQLLELFDLAENGDSPIRTLLRRTEEEDRPLLGAGGRGADLVARRAVLRRSRPIRHSHSEADHPVSRSPKGFDHCPDQSGPRAD